MHPTAYQSYAERSESANITPLATYLLRLIHLKQTNLCVSADVYTTSELLRVADEVGDHICVLKTHADTISDFSDKTVRGLTELAKRKKFIIFEDRKFLDIGNTVQAQYAGGITQIVRWAPIVNAAIFPGPAIIPALHESAKKAIAAYNTSVSTDISASPATSAVGSAGDEEEESTEGETDGEAANSNTDDDDRKGRKQSVVSVSTTISTKTETISPRPALKPTLSRGSTEDSGGEDEDEDARKEELAQLGPPPFFRSLLLLAEMSSAENRFTQDYTTFCVEQARQNRGFVMGFIAQKSLNEAPEDNFITMTPGVQKAAGGDGKGQQYNTPKKVVTEAGADIIIVGRGVLNVQDRRKEALEYRRQGWQAYEDRLRQGRRRRT